MEHDEYDRVLDEIAEYKAEMIAEAREKMEIEEAEEAKSQAELEHDEEVKSNPLRIIIEAIIEHEEGGQLCPQTREDLQLLLTGMEVTEKL